MSGWGSKFSKACVTGRLVDSLGDGGLIHSQEEKSTAVGLWGFAKWQSASLCILVKQGGSSLPDF